MMEQLFVVKSIGCYSVTTILAITDPSVGRRVPRQPLLWESADPCKRGLANFVVCELPNLDVPHWVKTGR